MLARPCSALVRAHGEACRLGRQRGRVPPRTLVYGDHRLRFPLMALTTSQEMGPARHALEQRVVAGFAATSRPGPRVLPSSRPGGKWGRGG